MMHRAVIFDLDGTLLDTVEDLGDCMNSALASLGYPPHSYDEYKYFVGDGFTTFSERSVPARVRGDAAVVAECEARARREYSQGWNRKTHLYEGIAELLDSLASRGIITAICSNKPHPAVQDVVGYYLGRWKFAAVVGSQPPVPKKPDPAVVHQMLGDLGLERAQCLYAGDTNTDMETAIRAGILAVGVLWGFRTRDELLQAGAQVLVSRPAEILDLL
jgi:phosphoglycolate phosphatase